MDETFGGVTERSEHLDDIWTYKITRAESIATIALSGELDTSGRAAATDLLVTEINHSGVTAVYIDMSAVSLTGSGGVEALLKGCRAAEAKGRHLAVTGVRDAPLRVLQITGVLAALTGDPAPRDATGPASAEAEAP
jgi:anti-anti-sigma factor